LKEHPGEIAFESLPRETQVYLVDLGYPCAESADFRKNVREVLDGVGRQRKYRRKVRTTGQDVEGNGANQEGADEFSGETNMTATQRCSE
jgi:hypothetical protein